MVNRGKVCSKIWIGRSAVRQLKIDCIAWCQGFHGHIFGAVATGYKMYIGHLSVVREYIFLKNYVGNVG